LQNIILCPKCRVQVKKDNLGELVCPSCNARLCPKAHIFNGKICTYCGWEDPNYSLWQKTQKDRLRVPRSRTPDEPVEIKAQYVCSNCGVSVDATQKRCHNCGMLGAKYKAAKAAPTGAISMPAKPTIPAKQLLESIPREPAMKRASRPAKSNFVKEVSRAERIHWQFPPLRHFVRPVLVSTVLCIIIIGLVFGGIYTARFIRQNIKFGVSPPSTAAVPNSNHGSNWSLISAHQPKTYKLSTNIIPQTAGEIRLTPPFRWYIRTGQPGYLNGRAQ
jgi:predicted RNA-binding Zn-ribbon protein involved in translation (DUF1610 family)